MQAVVWVWWRGSTPCQELSSREGKGAWSWYGCRAPCTVKPQPKLAGRQRPLQSSQLPKQIGSLKVCFNQTIVCKTNMPWCGTQIVQLLSPALGAAHRKQGEPWLSRGCAGYSPHQQPSKQVILPVSGSSPLSSPWPPSSCHPFPCHHTICFSDLYAELLNISQQVIPEPLWHVLLCASNLYLLMHSAPFNALCICLTTCLISLLVLWKYFLWGDFK